MKLPYLLILATVISSAEAATPISKYISDWVEGKRYQSGQVVSLDEKSWLCLRRALVTADAC